MNKFVTFKVRQLRFFNFKRHHKSKPHISNTIAFLEIKRGPTGKQTSGAPSAEQFQRILDKPDNFNTENGLVGFKRFKSSRMKYTLYEAMCMIDLDAVRSATSIGLQRDEAKGHLVIRFRACGADLKCHQGFMGKAKEFGTGAKAIANATNGLLR